MANHSDGSVIDDNLGVIAASSEGMRKHGMNSIYLGQIIKLYPIDSDGNHSKTQVEYDVLVRERSQNIITYRSCTRAEGFGGINNFNEVVLAASPNLNDALSSVFTVGSWVIIACVDGNYQRAKIIQEVQHPAWNQSIPKSLVSQFDPGGTTTARDDDMKTFPTLLPGASSGQLSANGGRILGEYNGFRWGIDSAGAFTVMAQGVKNADGTIANQNMGTIAKMDTSGRFTVIDPMDQSIVVDPGAGTITISNGQAQPSQVIVSNEGNSVTVAVPPLGQGKIQLGSAQSADPALLGQETVQLLTELLTALQALGVALLPAGVPAPAKVAFTSAITAITLQLTTPGILSQTVFTDSLIP